VCREVFTKSGTPRANLGGFRVELDSETVVIIHHFELYPGYRVHGAGVSPMRLSLNLIPQIVERDAESGQPRTVCLLSPARSESAEMKKEKKQDLMEVRAEHKLIRTFGRNNFRAWLQGDPDVEGSLTVMGKVI
jgi:hypothetical protein